METPNQQPFFNWVLGAFMAVLTWVVRIYQRKVYDLEKTQIQQAAVLATHAAQSVTRFELQKYMDDLRIEMSRDSDRLHDDTLRMHAENTVTMHRIDDAVIRLHQRIDNNRESP